MNLSDVLKRFEGVKKSGDGFTAKCPSHEDRVNSLKISQGDDDRILLKCHAGCEFADIVNTLGLKQSDFMPDKPLKQANKETSYKIMSSPLIEHVRIDEPGGKRFIWRRDGNYGLGGIKTKDLPLYEPQSNGKTKMVVITEGEKAAIAAARLGCRSYGTVCGAGSCPSREALSILKGENVILWADNDEPGQVHMKNLQEALRGIAESTVIITTGKSKDDAADYRGTLKDLKKVIDKTLGIHNVSRLSEFVGASLNSIARYCNNDVSDRIPTGISKLDYALRGGFMRKALYLLGAPSGHGKTTFLQNLAVHCARSRGSVVFISPEMSGMELAEREIIRVSGVSMNEVAPWKNPNDRLPSMDRMEKIAKEIEKEDLPIFVIDECDITMVDIKKIASKVEGVCLVIVDYAQEIADRTSAMARYLAVGEVGKEAIVMGKELDIPVIVASQVNVINDSSGKNYAFRETKDLEHRAHCSMIMEIKRSQSPNKYGFYDIEETRIFARKNRSGPVFSVDVDYNPATFMIKNKMFTPKEGY